MCRCAVVSLAQAPSRRRTAHGSSSSPSRPPVWPLRRPLLNSSPSAGQSGPLAPTKKISKYTGDPVYANTSPRERREARGREPPPRGPWPRGASVRRYHRRKPTAPPCALCPCPLALALRASRLRLRPRERRGCRLGLALPFPWRLITSRAYRVVDDVSTTAARALRLACSLCIYRTPYSTLSE